MPFSLFSSARIFLLFVFVLVLAPWCSAQEIKRIIDDPPKDALLTLRMEGGLKFIDTLGNVLLEGPYQTVEPFRGGVCVIKTGYTNAVINYKGEFVQPFIQDRCYTMYNGYYRIERGDRHELYNIEGKRVFSCDSCNFFVEAEFDRIWVHRSLNNVGSHIIQFFDLDSNLIFETKALSANRMQDLATVQDDHPVSLPFYEFITSSQPLLKRLVTAQGEMVFDSAQFHGFINGKMVVGIPQGYGVIDTSGNTIISPQAGWEHMEPLFGFSYFGVKKGDAYGIIDSTGKVWMPISSKQPLLGNNGIVSAFTRNRVMHYSLHGDTLIREGQQLQLQPDGRAPIEGNLRVFDRHQKMGLIDKYGKPLLPFAYDYISPPHEGKMAYFKGDSSGYMDLEGKVLMRINQEFLSGFVNRAATVGIFSIADQQTSECAPKTTAQHQEGTVQHRYIDEHGNWKGKTFYDRAQPFYEDIALVQAQCKSAWINSELKSTSLGKDMVLVTHFRHGVAVVQNILGLYGLVNTKGKVVLPCEYEEIGIREGKTFVRYPLYSRKGSVRVLQEKNDYPDYEGTTIRIRKGQLWGLANTKGKVVVEPRFAQLKLSKNGLFYHTWLQQNEGFKSGLIGVDGQIALPSIYDHVTPYTSYGYYEILKDDQWGRFSQTHKLLWPYEE